jgi:hypothetical protein
MRGGSRGPFWATAAASFTELFAVSAKVLHGSLPRATPMPSARSQNASTSSLSSGRRDSRLLPLTQDLLNPFIAATIPTMSRLTRRISPTYSTVP